MTITAIIKEVGETRSFEVPTNMGGKKTMTACEVQLVSGNNVFYADAYDQVCQRLQNAQFGEFPAVCELRFDGRKYKTQDGIERHQQSVTLVTFHNLH